MKKRLYIAYGSNLCLDQMASRCPNSKPICKTWLNDYKLVFQGRPIGAHANVIPAEGHRVPVAVWEITPLDEKALDRYEGVAGGYYTKEIEEVEINGEMHEALIYIMTPSGYGIPADHYLDIIVEGYRDFNLEANYLNEALIESITRAAAPKKVRTR